MAGKRSHHVWARDRLTLRATVLAKLKLVPFELVPRYGPGLERLQTSYHALRGKDTITGYVLTGYDHNGEVQNLADHNTFDEWDRNTETLFGL